MLLGRMGLRRARLDSGLACRMSAGRRASANQPTKTGEEACGADWDAQVTRKPKRKQGESIATSALVSSKVEGIKVRPQAQKLEEARQNPSS